MKILYNNKSVQKQCECYKEAKKCFNKVVAEKLHSTVNFILNSECLMDVNCMPNYNLHPLKGDKCGQFAIDLGRKLGYRLLITPLDEEGNHRKTTDNIHEMYKSTSVIIVLEVSNHYE